MCTPSAEAIFAQAPKLRGIYAGGVMHLYAASSANLSRVTISESSGWVNEVMQGAEMFSSMIILLFFMVLTVSASIAVLMMTERKTYPWPGDGHDVSQYLNLYKHNSMSVYAADTS